MIVYFNEGKKEYVLNQCEKQEIENIFKNGGRFFYRGNTDAYLMIYDQDEKGKPNKIIAELRGDTVNVLWELGNRTDDNFIEIFDIMQKYPNDRQVKLTIECLAPLKRIYNMGGRYIKRCIGPNRVLVYDKNKQNVKEYSGDTIYFTVLGIEKKFIQTEEGFLDLEKLLAVVYG